MKSNEFITEDWTPQLQKIQAEYKLSDEIIETALKIRDDCQPYLKQNKSSALHSPLFRGLRKPEQRAVVKKRVRLDNRNPSDMPTYLHKYINEYFVDYFGAPFRDSLFCSGSSVEASGYGKEYMIFPIGHYEFCWSPKIDDLWTAYDSFTSRVGSELDSGTDVYDMFIDDVVYNGDWKTSNLMKAINSRHEIMVRCEAYYGIEYDDMSDGKMQKGISEILAL